MTCSGTCTLCGKPRDRGGCRCFDRGGRQVDDIHGALLVADEYIRTERKFNREKHEIALALIGEAVCDIRKAVAARILDGRELMRVEKSAVVLKRKADGKLWATLSNNNDCPKHAAFNRDCKICRGEPGAKRSANVSAENAAVMARLHARRMAAQNK